MSKSLLAKAIAIASDTFKNSFDKGGEPYILHCLEVMNGVKHLGETAMICAVLHDLLEDRSDIWTPTRLAEEGFTSEIILILELLTHRKETPYMDYVKTLAVHNIAKAVKKADLQHNSCITRMKGLRKKDFDRLEKYMVAYTYLND